MKKYLILFAMLVLPISVHATNANIELSASPSTQSVGKTIAVTVNVNSTTPIGYYEYTLDYDHNKLELTSGNSYNVERANEEVKSLKKEFKFKVKQNSSNKISVKSYAVSSYRSEDSMSVTVKPVSINSSSSSETSQSDNNNLSNLEIEGYKIEPTFNKDTTNYIAKIEDDIDTINIKATTESSKASITGDGKQSIKIGDNRIEVTVTSESGKEKTYTIKVTLSEKNPIKVKINGKEYTVMKTISSDKALKNYKVTKIKIDNKEVEALTNSKTHLTLVMLKDENGKTNFYIYDDSNDSYKLYNEITSGDLSVIPVDTNKELANYTLYTETINNMEVDCYKISSNSKFCAIYAMNTENGKKDWYMYDLENNNIQRYNSDIEDFYKEKIDNTRILIYILSATTFLFGITTIAFAVKSNKKKKRYR